MADNRDFNRQVRRTASLTLALVGFIVFGVLVLADGDWIPGWIIVAAALVGLGRQFRRFASFAAKVPRPLRPGARRLVRRSAAPWGTSSRPEGATVDVLLRGPTRDHRGQLRMAGGAVDATLGEPGLLTAAGYGGRSTVRLEDGSIALPSATSHVPAVTAEDVRATLARADFYPGQPGRVEVRETLISWVFLAGDRAYKLKKPLALPFLDYGTPKRRRQMCREEVRLKSPSGARLYLGVRAVAGAPMA